MSNQTKNPQPVSIEQAEQITADIVMPMLNLAKFEISKLVDGEHVEKAENEMFMGKLDFNHTIKCLHFWQALVAALTMKMHSQTVLNYLMNTYSVQYDLINSLNNDILIADDNINFLSDELLKFGIKL